MKPRWQKQGFTLIEMVIAMTLLSILVVLLFTTFRMAADSWNLGEAKQIQTNKKAVVYQFLRNHLSSIRPVAGVSGSDDDGRQVLPPVEFDARSNLLHFVGSLPLSSARKGLQMITITQHPQDASTLIVTLRPYTLQPSQSGDQEVLIDHVKRFSFAYFGAANSGGGNNGATVPVWTNSWPNTGGLPLLIKVSIQLDDDSFWPDMVFPVRIGGQMQNQGVQSGESNN